MNRSLTNQSSVALGFLLLLGLRFRSLIERLSSLRSSGEMTLCCCFLLLLGGIFLELFVPVVICASSKGCLPVSVEEDAPSDWVFVGEDGTCNGEVTLIPAFRCRKEGAGKLFRLSIVSTRRWNRRKRASARIRVSCSWIVPESSLTICN